MEVKGKQVKLVKLKDEKFNGAHPWGVNEGYEKTGTAINDLEVGQFFYVQKGMKQFRSSTVTKINEDGTFNTSNSLYSIEILKEKPKRYRFYKEDTGKWYADIPEWEGEKWELEMVCGADTMLDLIAQGEDVAYLTLSLEPFVLGDDDVSSFELKKIKDTPDIGGALYLLKDFHGIEYNAEVWLCEVLRFVFGKLPDIIYLA